MNHYRVYLIPESYASVFANSEVEAVALARACYRGLCHLRTASVAVPHKIVRM